MQKVGSTIAICSLLFSTAHSAYAINDIANVPPPSMQVVKSFDNPDKPTRHAANFRFEPQLPDGDYIYTVEFDASAITDTYAFKALIPHVDEGLQGHPKVSELRQQVDDYQRQMMADINSLIGNRKSLYNYAFALNGVALKMSQGEAKKIAKLPGIKAITRDKLHQLDTDRGPSLIGAPLLWDGEITGFAPRAGEGIVVGIIDSGINSDHPSFAEVAGDGYVHSNPRGNGFFIGDCAGNFPELCNNKLIGVRSYPTITNNYADFEVFPPNLPRNGEDYDGHGSHVAATAAGNLLLNQVEIIPEQGSEESDGVASDITFEQVSGVAHRANIISYQVCNPGTDTNNDTYSGCPTSAINAGIEDAILDGVDVINMSISGGGDPWDNSTESAFLRARSAGIFVAVSAGNSGPNPSTSEKGSPWYTAVAASEHGRQNAWVKEINNYSGGNAAPPVITGQSNTGSIRAPIVYAGDFTNPNDPDGAPEQCLEPFPAGTFNGQIVVCDRGEIARVAKAQNVEAGGAGGYVLANVDGGDTFLANDQYVVPGIHIKAEQGNALKAWLSSGSNHVATITAATRDQFIDQDRVDLIANFSSRGPNTQISTLTPAMSAPGVDIFAAYADQQYGKDGDVPAAAGDFNYLQGTSMASPHVAGAGALLKSIHPSWTPDQIKSALSMTATSQMRLDDEVTDANFFDMGAGRIRVNLAAQVGLTMDVTPAQYRAANPDIDGDPRALNLPSITDNNCQGICTWQRTFTATKDGTWSVRAETISDGLQIAVSPSSFVIEEGQTQTVSVTIDSLDADKSAYNFARLILSADSGNSPSLSLPISILSNIGDIPSTYASDISRNEDEFIIADLSAISIENFRVTPFQMVVPTVVSGQILEDSNAGDYLDDLQDGVIVTEIVVPSNAKRLITKITSSTADDLDLFLIYDVDDDGFISSSEEIARSTSFNEIEDIEVNFPEAGRYFIVVQSFNASVNGQADDFNMHYAVVGGEVSNQLTIDAPNNTVDGQVFDIRVVHQLENLAEDELLYGALGLSNRTIDNDRLGMIALDLQQTQLDTQITGDNARLNVGDQGTIRVRVNPNTSDRNRIYRIQVPIPQGTDVTSFSTTNQGALVDNQLSWIVEKTTSDSSITELSFSIEVLESLNPGPIDVTARSELLNRTFESVLIPPSFTGLQIEGPPTITVNNEQGSNFVTEETLEIFIPISTDDPNNDDVVVEWTQDSGPAANIVVAANGATITAPRVEQDENLSFTVIARDPANNIASSAVTLLVENNEAPIIDSVTAPSSANRGQTITVSFTASDPEGDDLAFEINGLVGSSRNIVMPSSGTSTSINLRVSDGINTVTQSVNIQLLSPTPPPPQQSSGGGSLAWSFALFCLLISARRLHKNV